MRRLVMAYGLTLGVSLMTIGALLLLYGCDLTTSGTYEVITHGKAKTTPTENGGQPSSEGVN